MQKVTGREGRMSRLFVVLAVLLTLTLGMTMPANAKAKHHRKIPKSAQGYAKPGPDANGSSQAAASVSGYHVYNTCANGVCDGLNVRSGPHVSAGKVGWMAEGTQVSIVCQDYGDSVHGSTIWDQLDSPYSGWSSDWYINTPNIGSFSPGVPQCSVPPPPSRGQKAANRALAMVGQTNQPNGKTWIYWCELFAETAYGTSGQKGSALLNYQNLVSRGMIHAGDTKVPVGALAFYDTWVGNMHYGHVVISVGNGQFVTTPNGWDGKAIYETTLGRFGHYLGWSDAPPEWGDPPAAAPSAAPVRGEG